MRSVFPIILLITCCLAALPSAVFNPTPITQSAEPPDEPAEPSVKEVPENEAEQPNPIEEPEMPDPDEPPETADEDAPKEAQPPQLDETEDSTTPTAPGNQVGDQDFGTPETTEFTPLDQDTSETPSQRDGDEGLGLLEAILANEQTTEPQIPAEVTYHIKATLDADKKLLTARQRVTFTNVDDHDISALYFSLMLNGFKNEATTFWQTAKSQGLVPKTGAETWGFLDIGNVQIAGRDATHELAVGSRAPSGGLDETVARLDLAQPLSPGETIQIDMDFTAKLPKLFHQTGYRKDFLLVAHWFPKLVRISASDSITDPAVPAYHPDDIVPGYFASFHVALDVPKAWHVAATGDLIRKNETDSDVTFIYEQDRVRDFALITSPDLVTKTRRFEAATWIKATARQQAAEHLGIDSNELAYGDIDVTILLQPHHQDREGEIFDAVFQGLQWFSLNIGPYPYASLTIVDPPWGVTAAQDLSFPTLCTAGTDGHRPFGQATLTARIFNGIARQYWCAAVGFNQTTNRWLASGLPLFSSLRALQHTHGAQVPIISANGLSFPVTQLLGYAPVTATDWFVAGMVTVGNDHALTADPRLWDDSALIRHARSFKSAAVLKQLAIELGDTEFDRILHATYHTWKFKHPTPATFQSVAEHIAGQNLDWFFNAYVRGTRCPDLQVVSIDNKRLDTTLGYLETRDGRELIETPKQAKRRFKSMGHPTFQCSIVLANPGVAPGPVDVEILFAEGRKEQLTWNGRSPRQSFMFASDSAIERVTIDPERHVVVDINPANNHLKSAESTSRVRPRWCKGLILIQQVIQSLMGVF